MSDMLVSLVELPPVAPLLNQLRQDAIFIRRPNPWEQSKLYEYIAKNFSQGWADETSVAFHSRPVSCYVAVHEGEFLGFSAYECTRRGYFGPTGVLPEHRGKHLGKVLLLAALNGLLDLGYTYAVIGSAGPKEFYRKTLGAIEIPFANGRGIYDLQEDPRLRALK